MLCDTNIISELAKPKPNPGVIAWAEQQHHIALSTITIEEIQYGLAWKPNPRIKLWLDNFIQDFCDVLPITQRIAQIAGEIRGTLQAKGETRTQADMLIAATSAVHDLPLATRNINDFTGCGIQLMNPFSHP
jgi:predicted nucleic acid-binding protein